MKYLAWCSYSEALLGACFILFKTEHDLQIDLIHNFVWKQKLWEWVCGWIMLLHNPEEMISFDKVEGVKFSYFDLEISLMTSLSAVERDKTL